MDIQQIIRVAKTTAELIHYTFAWKEALNGDIIELLVNEFKKELNELNGNS